MRLGSFPDDPQPPQVGVDAVSKEAHQRAIGKKVSPCPPGPGPGMGQSDPCGNAHSLTGDCLGRYNLKVAHGDPNNKFDPVSGHTVRFFKAELATSSHPHSFALHPHPEPVCSSCFRVPSTHERLLLFSGEDAVVARIQANGFAMHPRAVGPRINHCMARRGQARLLHAPHLTPPLGALQE